MSSCCHLMIKGQTWGGPKAATPAAHQPAAPESREGWDWLPLETKGFLPKWVSAFGLTSWTCFLKLITTLGCGSRSSSFHLSSRGLSFERFLGGVSNIRDEACWIFGNIQLAPKWRCCLVGGWVGNDHPHVIPIGSHQNPNWSSSKRSLVGKRLVSSVWDSSVGGFMHLTITVTIPSPSPPSSPSSSPSPSPSLSPPSPSSSPYSPYLALPVSSSS